MENSLGGNNALINVPKKYQYRGKRLNIDNQSITSSSKSKVTTETFQKNIFHTKSGPIQTNETLCIRSNDSQPMYKSRKLKLQDYKIRGITSPTESGNNDGDLYDTNQNFSSVNQRSSNGDVLSSHRSNSRGSIKPLKIKKSKENLHQGKGPVKAKIGICYLGIFIDTQQLIKRRLELIQMDEDEEAHDIDDVRKQKRKEAKARIQVADSVGIVFILLIFI